MVIYDIENFYIVAALICITKGKLTQFQLIFCLSTNMHGTKIVEHAFQILQRKHKPQLKRNA